MLTLLFLVCLIFAIAHGAMFLVWPARYREIIAALWGMNGQSAQVKSWREGYWGQRLVGAAITLAGSAVMWRVIHARLALKQTSPSHVSTNALWLDPLAATVLFLGGFFALVYPKSIVKWSFGQIDHLEGPEGTSNYRQMGARLLGIAALTAAALTIYLWTGRTH